MLRAGVLTMNIRQSIFIEEWGSPDRTRAVSGEEIVSAGWTTSAGKLAKETLEIWEYGSKKTSLAFRRNKRLIAWKTEATVAELSSPPPKPPPGPQPRYP
jgi:hypothetical protein